MGGQPLEGLTDATLRITRRSVGSDQGFSAWARGPCRRHRGRQSIVRRCGGVPISGGYSVARPAGAFRRLEDRLSALQQMAKSGVFERIFKLLASDHDNEYMMIDATIVRAHQHSAGARKKTARTTTDNRTLDRPPTLPLAA